MVADVNRDIRTLLGMDRPIALAVVALFCLSTAARPLTDLGDGRQPWPILAAIALCVAAAVAIVVVPGDPLPAPVAVALTALGPVTCLLVLPQVPTTDWIMSDIWQLRIVAAVLCFVSLRGRIVHACTGGVLTAATFTAWTAVTGQGWEYGLRLSTLAFAPVLISVFVAITVRPMASTVFRLRDRENERAVENAMILAVTAERERQLAALDASARPLLEAGAAGRHFDPDQREDCAVLEEHLRDTLRAPVFADDADVRRATAAARRRGTRVVLLDDGGLTDPTLVEAARVALVDELDATAGGTLTARALPAGRTVAATIVAEDSGRVRRVEYDRDGAVRTEVRNGEEPDPDHQAVRSIAGT